MGVRAHQHATDLVINMGRFAREKAQREHPDKKAPGTYLSPSAQLMLGHIALSTFESEATMQNGYWNKDHETREGLVFYQGLGKRARALGFDLPPTFDKSMVLAGDVDEKLYNAARMASDRALRELVSKGLITRIVEASAGRNARYFLDFLYRPCGTCLDPNTEGVEKDLRLHLEG
ncbi:hypothetical protein [Arthrobacter sp. MYb227]|uniref:hypothetical protein n=1 Tax=Arthrobacter sp. MYb227 TaxID=1848601 RepID=UPI0011B0B685|nr:hypothetical protein [Arthrobacter sp. MYb227]